MWQTILKLLGFCAYTFGSLAWVFQVIPVQDWFRRKLFSPKLRIEFDEIGDCYESTFEKYSDDKQRMNRKYIRIKVSNQDITTAEDCRIILESVEEIKTCGAKSKIEYKTPQRLRWAKHPLGGGNDEGFNVHSGSFEYLDLIVTVDDPSGSYLVILDCSYTRVLEFKKRYRFHICGKAKNSPPVEFECDIVMGSKWDDPFVIRSERISINSCKNKKR